jgi:ATP-dependent DNA ligase
LLRLLADPGIASKIRFGYIKIVIEVEALEVSKRRHLRAPVFLRKRADKLPEECTIDQLHYLNTNATYPQAFSGGL